MYAMQNMPEYLPRTPPPPPQKKKKKKILHTSPKFS